MALISDDEVARELADHITEYLQYHDMSDTLEAFVGERRKLHAGLANSSETAELSRDEVYLSMIRCFDAGLRDKFFVMWERFIPASLRRHNVETQKVEFYLNIYFAIFPALPGAQAVQPEGLESLASTMRTFKAYLEDRGAELARTGEFLAYYALPFVPGPAQHPSFTGLFEPLWTLQQRERLERLLATSPDSLPRPRLYTMYEGHYGLGPEDGDGGASARPVSAFLRGDRELDAYVGSGSERGGEEDGAGGGGDELHEPERSSSPDRQGGGTARDAKAPDAMDWSASLRDWRPADRARAAAGPEAAVDEEDDGESARGGGGSAAESSSRDGGSAPPSSRRSRGGGAAEAEAAAPLAEQGDGGDDGARSELGGGGAGVVQGASGAMISGDPGDSFAGMLKGNEVMLGSVHLGGSGTPRHNVFGTVLAPLDMGRVRAALASASVRGEKVGGVARLLQALRLRIIRSPPGADRRRVLETYIQGDVLGCTAAATAAAGSAAKTLAETCSRAAAPEVQEQLARLLNVLASDAAVRTYLLQPGARTVDVLVDMLLLQGNTGGMGSSHGSSDRAPGGGGDTVTAQNCLGALQKFSLRRSAQARMIQMDLIRWIASTLRDLDTLSEYTTEYGTALLMNLSLRSAGKRKCEDPGVDILSVLNDLIESENLQVRTYVNGTLYSVLQRPALREAARAMGMEDFLVLIADGSDETFARQIEYILAQLRSDEGAGGGGGGGGEEDDGEDSGDEEGDPIAEDEEDDEDFWTDDDDGGADNPEEELLGLLTPGGLRPPGAFPELTGEELLCAEYLLSDSAVAAREVDQATATVLEAEAQRSVRASTASLRPGSAASSHGGSNFSGQPLQRPATPSSARMASLQFSSAAPTAPRGRDDTPKVTLAPRRPLPPGNDEDKEGGDSDVGEGGDK